MLLVRWYAIMRFTQFNWNRKRKYLLRFTYINVTPLKCLAQFIPLIAFRKTIIRLEIYIIQSYDSEASYSTGCGFRM